jgi:hypothetical protein
VTSITAHTPSNRRNKDKGKYVLLQTTNHSKFTFLSDSHLLSNDTQTSLSELSSPTPLTPIFSFGNGSTLGKMGNLSQKQNHPSRRRDHQQDTSRSHLDLGLVRSRNDESLAKHLPPHGEEQDLRIPRLL